MLSSEQIIKEGLLKLDNTHGKPAQVGYDLSIKSVQKIMSNIKFGYVLKDKTLLAHYEPMDSTQLDGHKYGFMYIHKCTHMICFKSRIKYRAINNSTITIQ